MKKKAVLLSLLCFGCEGSSKPSSETISSQNADPMPTVCKDAHEAYARGDFAALTSNVVLCLQNQAAGPLVRKNIEELLKSAYVHKGGRLPSDFRLPEGVTKLRLSQRLANPNKRIAVELKGEVAEGMEIANLALLDAKGNVIVDRSSEGVEWQASHDSYGVKLNLRDPLPSGLYKVVVEVDGREPEGQWAPVVDWLADELPEMLTPQHNANIVNANPMVSWRALPERDSGFSWSAAFLSVNRVEPPNYEWNRRWEINLPDLTVTTVVVGKEDGGTGVERLENGRFVASLTHSQARRYGQLHIVKSSSVRHTFVVRP